MRFEVVAGELKFIAGQSLDFETGASVEVIVTAMDNGGLRTSQTFTVKVTDVNEAPGTVTLSASSVAENAVAAVIGTLSVTDVDAGDSHTYSVDDGRFEVVSGELKLIAGQSLDFETEASVDVIVTAIDNGGLSTSQTFTVNVTDVNEAPGTGTLSANSVAENAVAAVIGK